MVFVLPENKSFASELARGFGGGMSQGVSSALQLVNENIAEKMKMEKRKKLFEAIRGQGSMPGSPSSVAQQLAGGTQQSQASSGSPFEEAYMATIAGEPEMARIFSTEAKVREQERSRRELARERMEFQRETKQEPQITALQKRLASQETEAMRFDRLEQLFSPELESKFPPAILAGMLTEDGELRPTALASLSEEAQEAIKLIYDNLSGAKDTYGARVTNFDVQTYMRRLPTLLNTAEGKRRVLKDLQQINKINRLHDEAVLDIIEEHGGAGKMPMSKADMIFRKRYAPQIEEMRKQFVRNGMKEKRMESLPPPGKYNGKVAVDEDTGKRYRSDGKSWVPIE